MEDFAYYFFDLYHTLVLLEPNPPPEENEADVLGISRSAWSRAALVDYEDRALGRITDHAEIVASIARNAGAAVDAAVVERLVKARRERYRRTFSSIRPAVLETLSALRSRGAILVLVSNADAFDSLFWADSPLAPLFSAALFSWEVGCMKPDPRIYELAMAKAAADPDRSVFVGDGGHRELSGAKAAGLRTILTTELIGGLWPEAIPGLSRDADGVIGRLSELVGYRDGGGR